jgi:hypothetical protein
MSRLSRASALGAATALVCSLVMSGAPRAAAGAVTATTITRVTGVPAGYSLTNVNRPAGTGPMVTAAGTAVSSTPGGAVDVRCYYTDDDPDGFASLATDVPEINGVWSASGALSAISGERCRLVAVPTGWDTALSDPSSAPFKPGALLNVGTTQVITKDDPPSAGTATEFEISAPSSRASNEFDVESECGPVSLMNTAAPLEGPILWDCAVDLFHQDRGEDRAISQSAVRIDGHDVFTANSINTSLRLTHGGITVHHTQNPRTGDVMIEETQPYYYCRSLTNAFIETEQPGQCPALKYAGVVLHRTYLTSHQGQTVVVSDSWRSSIHAKLALTLEYETILTDGETSDPDTALRLPGASGYSVSSPTGTRVSTNKWPAVGAIDVRQDVAPGTTVSVEHPAGALSWSTRPNAGYLTRPGEFFLNYSRAIPARGSFTLTHSLAMSSTQAEVNKLAAAQIKADRPTLSFRAPTRSHQHSLVLHGRVVNGGNGAITSVMVTIGTAKAHKVNVSAKGAFRFRVHLANGRNHIEVSGKDPVDNVAKAAHTVRRG